MREKELTAPIFQIVHGSSVDGWGVRTTIFLKGCPLRCLWCCNPEGQNTWIELKYTKEDCDGCGHCLEVCPRNAVSLSDTGKAVIDRSLCDNCMKCKEVCHTGALDVFGKSYTVEEIFREVAKDQLYFGLEGGVTIGGGEATLFPDFTLELIRRLQASYIHTALDTCGYIRTEKGYAALMEADLVLFDIKGMNDEKHKEATGVSNRIIHENLKLRNETGKDIIIRLPIIPGYTDSDENLRETAEFLAPMKAIKRIDILPMHKYSELKYRQLGWKIPEVFDKDLEKDRDKEIRDMFLKYGFHVRIGG